MKNAAKEHSLKRIGTMVSLLKEDKACLLLTVASAAASSALTIAAIVFPRYILDELVGGKNMQNIIRLILAMTGTFLLIKLILDVVQRRQALQTEIFSRRVSEEICGITGRMPLKDLEDSGTRDKILLAQDSSGCGAVLGILRDLLSQALTIAGVLTIICTFDIGTMLIVSFALALKILSQSREIAAWQECRDRTVSLSREGVYVANVGLDARGGKEVRMHGLAGWLNRKSTDINEKACRVFAREFRLVLLFGIAASLVYTLQLAYCYLIFTKNVISGEISLGFYSMYIGAVLAFTQGVSGMTEKLGELKKHMVYGEDLKKLRSSSGNREEKPKTAGALEEEKPKTAGALEKKKFTISFEHVWFRYPHTETDILRDVCFTVGPGEKIAFVGKNGAGKSTVIKLLCRFYPPTRGRITVNGIEIEKIPLRQYMGYLGVVFQDYQTYAFSIQENIRMGRVLEEEKLKAALKKAGLDEAVEALPRKDATQLSRKFDEEGVELSGGQTQRLALARCLYQEAGIYILDEPTASLDPLAEYEFYQRFAEMIEDRSAVFISHRMSGAKFCSRVIVLDQGMVVQQGSHQELLGQAGVYRDMFLKQAEGYL